MRTRDEPTASLKPYPSNPRKDHDVGAIAASIAAYGFRQPIVVYDGDGMIVAGHGRLLAAKQLGLDKVPVHRIGADEKTPAQVAGYRLADNKSAERASWDDRMLLLELEALAEEQRKEAGFDRAYLDDLRRRQELESFEEVENEDDLPSATEAVVSKPGDLWTLGDHLLLCGDATVAEDVARLGDHGHLMVTDPPYGVNYDPEWRDRELGAGRNRSLGAFSNDDQADWSKAWHLFTGDVAYVWSASGGNTILSGIGLINSGFTIRTQLIWTKQHFVISRGNYHPQHETCWYCVRKGSRSHWRGDRTQATVWECANASAFGGNTEGEEKTNHSTQKPVELMRRPLLNNSNKGDLVYEPFCGSGSTIIAAQTCGRRARSIEINPTYVDLAVRRWQAFTKQHAVHEDGRIFDEHR